MSPLQHICSLHLDFFLLATVMYWYCNKTMARQLILSGEPAKCLIGSAFDVSYLGK